MADSCVICFAALTDQRVGRLACHHSFCFACIESWASVVNTCPLCKARFTQIETDATPRGKKGGAKKPRVVRVAEAEPEVSYGPEEFAEEFYGDAQDALLEESEPGAIGFQFIAFGMANYDEDEDEDFASSDLVLAEEEEMVQESSSSSSDSSSSDSSSSSSSDFEVESSSVRSSAASVRPDPLASVWRGRDESWRMSSPGSSSATPLRPVRRGRSRVKEEEEEEGEEEEKETRYPLRTRSAVAPPPAPRRPPSPSTARRAPPRPRRRREAEDEGGGGGEENAGRNVARYPLRSDARAKTSKREINLVDEDSDSGSVFTPS